MGRGDAAWHAAMGGVLLVGFLVLAPMLDAAWERQNSGYYHPSAVHHLTHAAGFLTCQAFMRLAGGLERALRVLPPLLIHHDAWAACMVLCIFLGPVAITPLVSKLGCLKSQHVHFCRSIIPVPVVNSCVFAYGQAQCTLLLEHNAISDLAWCVLRS